MAVGAAIGCSSSEAVPADCSSVASGVKRYWAERAETAAADELAAIEETRKLAVARLEQHCRDDKWNEELIKCVRATFRVEDSGCLKFMTNGQKTRWQHSDGVPGGLGLEM